LRELKFVPTELVEQIQISVFNLFYILKESESKYEVVSRHVMLQALLQILGYKEIDLHKDANKIKLKDSLFTDYKDMRTYRQSHIHTRNNFTEIQYKTFKNTSINVENILPLENRVNDILMSKKNKIENIQKDRLNKETEQIEKLRNHKLQINDSNMTSRYLDIPISLKKEPEFVK